MTTSWNAERFSLEDETQFDTLNGLWTGKKPPFVTAGVIRNTNFTESGRIDFSDVAFLEVEEKQLSKRQLRSGDIIIERSGGGPKQPVGRVVYFAREDGPFSFSNFTSVIRVRDTALLDPKFVFFRLLELYQNGGTEDIQRRTTGIRNLDFASYKQRATIPRLPLPAQRTIVSILELVQHAIAQQDTLIALVSELRETLLNHLLTHGVRSESQKESEIGPVPQSWQVVRLGEIAETTSGGTPSRKEPRYFGGSIPWVKSGELEDSMIYQSEERLTDSGLKNSAAKILPAGTILMAMYGATVGKTGTLGITASTNQAICAILPHLGRADAQFIRFALIHQRPSILKQRYGGAQPNISQQIIRNLPLPLPLLAEQQEIAANIAVVDRKIAAHHRKRATLAALFRSMLHQMMTTQIQRTEIAAFVTREAS